MSSSEFSRTWHFARLRAKDDRLQHVHFVEGNRNGFQKHAKRQTVDTTMAISWNTVGALCPQIGMHIPQAF
ncbi:GM12713 [Drosophila sechellia]|uniref:GM12713 n=1 Tax=Drosophila sechellia TaxID=7238 RepID=B4I145_DROSE|nr:GM12713 [Drosophila sechellia]